MPVLEVSYVVIQVGAGCSFALKTTAARLET